MPEILRGFADWRRWAWLGVYDVRLQNRRSFFGMWWPTLANAAFVFGVGYMFSALMGQDLQTFLPHLALGYIVWQVIGAGVSHAGQVFTGAERVLLEAVLPINTIVLRSLTRVAFQLSLTLTVPAVVFFYIGQAPAVTSPLAILGILANFLILHGTILFLGLLCARFRDLGFLIDSVMRLVFFLTPVLWMPSQASFARSVMLDLNPFYYMIEVVRAPILGEVPSLFVYLVVLLMIFASNAVGILTYSIFRKRLVYWL